MTGRFKKALLEKKTPLWQRKEGKDPDGSLSVAGSKSAGVGRPVTKKPSKLKKGSKAAKRRKSFCSRMGGMKKKLTSKKTASDPDSRINKALRKWNCSTDVNPNSLQNMVENFYIDLAVEEFIEMHESQGTDIGDLHGDFLSESCSYWLDNVSQVREAFGRYPKHSGIAGQRLQRAQQRTATNTQDDPLQRMARMRSQAGISPKAQVPMKPKAASNFMGDTMKRGIPRNKPIPKATPSRFGALGDITKSIAGRYADPARDAFDSVKSFMTDPSQRQKAIDAGKSRLKSFGGGIRSGLRGAGDRFKKFINRRIIPDTQSKFESLSDYELDRLVEHFIKLERTRNRMFEMVLMGIQENKNEK